MKSATGRNLFYSFLTFMIKTFNQLIIFVVLAKILDIPSFGEIGYFITITLITSNVVDFGYRLFLVKDFSLKEISQNLDSINNAIFMNLFMISIAFLFMLTYNHLTSNNSILVLTLFFISGCFISFGNLFKNEPNHRIFRG